MLAPEAVAVAAVAGAAVSTPVVAAGKTEHQDEAQEDAGYDVWQLS